MKYYGKITDPKDLVTKEIVDTKQDTLVSGTNIKTLNGENILGSGNLKLEGLPEGGSTGDMLVKTSDSEGDATWKPVQAIYTGDEGGVEPLVRDADTLQGHNAAYFQQALVSATNIKTINNQSVLGSGNLVVTASGCNWGDIVGTLSNQTDLQTALDAKQDTLVSGTNIKTVNSTTLLGSGDLAVQPTITSTTDLTAKTINAGLVVLTTAPTEANTNGLKIVVLSSEPETKYDGYLYVITG